MPDDENDAKLRGTVWALVVVVGFCAIAIVLHSILVHWCAVGPARAASDLIFWISTAWLPITY